MNGMQTLFDHYGFALWIVLLVLVLLALLWLWNTHRRVGATQARLSALYGDVGAGNTGDLLAEYLGTARRTAVAVSEMKQQHEEVVALMPSVIRHVGLVRFSPFHDTGGDQSFALALLDGKGDGVVVTGLHHRADSRLYAKPIEGQGSPYNLTPEEKEAIAKALGKQLVTSSD